MARVAVTVMSAGLALAACGDDDEPVGADGQGDERSESSLRAEASETVTVEIPEFSFDPDPVTVAVGQEIVWENAHNQAHTSTSDDDTWSTGNIAAGEAAEPVTIDEPGTYAYICSFHPFMEGTVEVES